MLSSLNLTHVTDSDDSSEAEDDEDDIVMPEGRPPGSDEDSDGIEMPEGPPPPKNGAAPPLIYRPPLPAAPQHQQPVYPMSAQFMPQFGLQFGLPPPPPGPPPVTGMYGVPIATPMQNPMYSAGPRPMPGIPLPPGPPPAHIQKQQTKPSAEQQKAAQASATITAAPQLRDLKAEATAFVPAALKRKRPGQQASAVKAAGIGSINAAPADDGEASSAPVEARSSLLGALKGAGVASEDGEQAYKKSKTGAPGQQDYERFLEGFTDV